MRTDRSHDTGPAAKDGAAAGAAVYTKQTLLVYDALVLRFANTFAWKCPSRFILDFYNEHVSARDLDVGVGTGHFLDKCRFPSSSPTLALLDVNPNSLQVASERVRRYNPIAWQANVLEPLRVQRLRFDSIGFNYLLHCLPGQMLSKGVVFRHLKPLLNAGGVVFGTTILGQGVEPNALAKLLLRIYNSTGIFSNASDNLVDLDRVMRENFSRAAVQVVGCVAFFVGRA